MEIWKTVFGCYEISNLGRVRSTETNKVLKPYKKGGYERIKFAKEEGNKSYAVSRLVAQAFIKNKEPERKRWVDHINRVRDDNRVENLRWVTRKENCNNTIFSDRTKTKRLAKIEEIVKLSQNGKSVEEIFKILNT